MSTMNTKLIIYTTLTVVILSCSGISAAIGTWSNFTYSDNSRDIICDGSYVWCVTSGGLIRYDISSGEIYKYLNSDGLGDIDILSVDIDTAGAVYLGGSNSTISKLKTDTQVRVYEFQYTSDIRYNILDLEIDNDIMWVASDIGIGKFLINVNDGEFQDIIPQLGDLPRETAVRTVKVIGDNLWAGTDIGLAYIDKNSSIPQNPQNWVTIIEGQNGLTDASIYSIERIADTVLVGTGDGVFMLGTDSVWQNIGLISRTVFDLKDLTAGLTAATDNGIYQRSGGTWNLLLTDSLITQIGKAVTEDLQGNIWAAFEDGGFGIYRNGFWEIITVPGPVSNYISDIAVDSLKNVWLTYAIAGFTSPEGISKYDGENWENFNSANAGIQGNGAFAVEYDVNLQQVWFGSWGDGVFSYDDDTTWVNFDESNSPLGGLDAVPGYVPVTDVAVSDRGDIWILQVNAENPPVTLAMFSPDDSSWAVYAENPGQISNHFQSVLFIDDKDVYIGGTNVYHFNYGDSPADTSDDFVWEILLNTSGGEVNALAVDQSGQLFIGMSSGLAYYDLLYNDTIMIELPDGYRSAINSIAVDGLGNKWVGTDSGVVVLSSSFGFTQANWINKFKTSNSFLLSNFVQHIEIDMSTGMVYIATTSGLSIYESGFAAPSAELSDVAVYPNPVNIKKGDTEINFLRVPADAEIFIYTAAGELVKRFFYYEGGNWNLKNENNQTVAAGVYFFHVHSRGNSGSGKFAIIR